MDNCLFCKIINGKEKSYIIYEDNEFISFLDKKPVFHGHCLLLPKTHINTLYDLPNEKTQHYFQLLQKIGKAVETAMEAEGSFIAINNNVSQSIPHLHTHIVPRNFKDGLKGFFWPRTSYESEDNIKHIQEKIIKALLHQGTR